MGEKKKRPEHYSRRFKHLSGAFAPNWAIEPDFPTILNRTQEWALDQRISYFFGLLMGRVYLFHCLHMS